jgi:VanZ family protein
MRRLGAAIGWFLTFVIVVLSVVPPSERPTTGTPSNFEHFAIYLLTGVAFGIGHWNRPWIVALGLIAFSGSIEAVQLWIPGRHARLSDFVIDSAAACAGVGVAMIAQKLIQHRSVN